MQTYVHFESETCVLIFRQCIFPTEQARSPRPLWDSLFSDYVYHSGLSAYIFRIDCVAVILPWPATLHSHGALYSVRHVVVQRVLQYNVCYKYSCSCNILFSGTYQREILIHFFCCWSVWGYMTYVYKKQICQLLWGILRHFRASCAEWNPSGGLLLCPEVSSRARGRRPEGSIPIRRPDHLYRLVLMMTLTLSLWCFFVSKAACQVLTRQTRSLNETSSIAKELHK